MSTPKTADILADKAESLLGFDSPKISKDKLHLPGPDFAERIFGQSDRSPQVIKNLQQMFGSGRLADTGYLSILPVDQGIEHTAGFSFAPNPDYFDPENIVRLAIEGGCNAVASTYGVLSLVSKKYADEIPFILKINHNELVSHPNRYDQILFASVDQAYEMGAVGIGATIYFGSEESSRQIEEISGAFEYAHQKGMFTVLWCYVRNKGAFVIDGTNYETAADITAQANHLGATLGADIVKQKLPTTNYGFKTVDYGKWSDDMYDNLVGDHPIDWTRYQVIHGQMGRVGLINSGGGSGDNDLQEVVVTATINKRAGGMGLISGRKAFQKPLKEGIAILNAIQDVYLDDKITVA